MLIFPSVRKQHSKRFIKSTWRPRTTYLKNVGVVLKHQLHTWATALAVMISNMSMRGNLMKILLAILNKKKKLSFDAEFDPRHQNYEVQIDADADVADTDQVVPIPDAKESHPLN